MTNKFNELSSEEMEDIKSDSSSPSIYTPDEEMEKKGYEWDSTGLYKPYRYKHEINPDPRDIYLKIERLPDKKTDFIIYSWNYKKDGEFKRLNYFRRSFLPAEEEIDSGGKASINRKLSHTGRLARLNSAEGKYKSFMEELLMDIINSPCLDVFKELDFEFPILPDEDEEDDEGMDEYLDAYLQRLHPELSDEDMESVQDVKDWIQAFGLIKYWDSLANPFHVGNHKAIYRKHLGGFNVIRGKGSYFIYTKAKFETGKSLEDEIAFILMIPNEFIYKKKQMSLSSFSRKSKKNIRYFERMIIYFGDLGNKKAYEKIEDVFDAIKTLITEGEFSRDLTEGNSSNFEDESLDLKADSIGAVFQTVRFDFLGDEEDQIGSRSIKSTPLEVNDDEVLDLLFALDYEDSYQNARQEYAKQEAEKYHKYLLWIIRENIRVIVPYRKFFKRFVKNSESIFRDFKQMLGLFNAYCTLTYWECLKTKDGKLIASPEQLETFIAELSLENVLPPVESNFLKMLMSKGNKTELKIIHEESDDLSPMANYENAIMEHLHFNENLDKYEYETFGDLELSKKKSAIAKLLEFYRLGGTGINHADNVFFRVNDLQRVHSSKRAFKDVDDVGALLNKLYSDLYLEKLEYKDNNGRNIYYLTSKCEELLNQIKFNDEDLEEANEFLKEQDIDYKIEYEIKAESEEKNAE